MNQLTIGLTTAGKPFSVPLDAAWLKRNGLIETEGDSVQLREV